MEALRVKGRWAGRGACVFANDRKKELFIGLLSGSFVVWLVQSGWGRKNYCVARTIS
jgi:hypothetical protein